MNTSTRRAFIQSCAATVVAATVQLRHEVNRERLLGAFCSKQRHCRSCYELEMPYGIGEFTYATDAKAICRAPIPCRLERRPRRVPSNTVEVFETHAHADAWQPFHLPSPASGVLRQCANGDVDVCPLCDNRTIFLGEYYPPEASDPDWVGVHCYDVDENTIRDPSCPLCLGKPFPGPNILVTCGVPFVYSDLKRIAALPGVRVAASRVPGCMAFRADGFEGAAMGIRLCPGDLR